MILNIKAILLLVCVTFVKCGNESVSNVQEELVESNKAFNLSALTNNNFELPALYVNGSKTETGNETNEDDNDEASAYISAPLCIQLHPGLEMITRGIDISKIDLTADNNDIGTVGKIFDFACNLGTKTTTVKQTKDTQKDRHRKRDAKKEIQKETQKEIQKDIQQTIDYSIPDHLLVQQHSSSNVPNSANLLYNLVKLKDEMGVKVGDDGPLPIGAFAESSTYKRFQESITNASLFMTTMKVTYTAFTVTVEAPKEVLSRRFKSAYNRLPLLYQNDPIAVQNFVKSYGTHYFEKATFGGSIHYVSTINVALRELMPEANVVLIATNAYKKDLEGKGGLKYYFAEDNEIFKQNSKTSINYFGGDLSLLAKNQFNEWRESLASKPHPLSVVVKPITDLMPDGSKKEAVKEAIQAYLGDLYLEDLLRILSSSIYQQSITAADANYYIFKIQQQLNSGTRNGNDVALLGSEVEKWAFTPQWLLDNVQLVVKMNSYNANECEMPETMVPINSRSPLPKDEATCSTFIKGLEMRLKTTGHTDQSFNPSYYIIVAKINPYRINFRLSPLAYRNNRIPAWARLLRYCIYANGLIKCLKLEETTYFDRSYENFQVALKTSL